MKVVLRAWTDDEYCEGPSMAVVEFDKSLLKEAKRLHGAVRSANAYSITEFDLPSNLAEGVIPEDSEEDRRQARIEEVNEDCVELVGAEVLLHHQHRLHQTYTPPRDIESKMSAF